MILEGVGLGANVSQNCRSLFWQGLSRVCRGHEILWAADFHTGKKHVVTSSKKLSEGRAAAGTRGAVVGAGGAASAASSSAASSTRKNRSQHSQNNWTSTLLSDSAVQHSMMLRLMLDQKRRPRIPFLGCRPVCTLPYSKPSGQDTSSHTLQSKPNPRLRILHLSLGLDFLDPFGGLGSPKP